MRTIFITIILITFTHLLYGQVGSTPKPLRKYQICQIKVDKIKDNKILLKNGTILKIQNKLGKNVHLNNSLLIKNDLKWKLSSGHKTYNIIEILHPPLRCNEPPMFKISLEKNTFNNKLPHNFLINKKIYYGLKCKNMNSGNRVVFSNIEFTDENVHHTCLSASFYNVDTFQSCSVMCKFSPENKYGEIK